MKKVKAKKFILQNSITVINKHISNLSVSISGELAYINPNLFQRKMFKSDLEMF